MPRVTEVLSKLYEDYCQNTPKRLKLIDAYLLYILLTGIVQFIYCCLVGTYPFNSFLSGFISTVASFVLADTVLTIDLTFDLICPNFLRLICPENTCSITSYMRKLKKKRPSARPAKRQLRSTGRNLRTRAPSEFAKITPKSEPEAESDGSLPRGYFKINRIIDERFSANGRAEYLVEWNGYDAAHNSWEPAKNVTGFALREFQKRRTTRPVPRAKATIEMSPTRKLDHSSEDFHNSKMSSACVSPGKPATKCLVDDPNSKNFSDDSSATNCAEISTISEPNLSFKTKQLRAQKRLSTTSVVVENDDKSSRKKRIKSEFYHDDVSPKSSPYSHSVEERISREDPCDNEVILVKTGPFSVPPELSSTGPEVTLVNPDLSTLNPGLTPLSPGLTRLRPRLANRGEENPENSPGITSSGRIVVKTQFFDIGETAHAPSSTSKTGALPMKSGFRAKNRVTSKKNQPDLGDSKFCNVGGQNSSEIESDSPAVCQSADNTGTRRHVKVFSGNSPTNETGIDLKTSPLSSTLSEASTEDVNGSNHHGSTSQQKPEPKESRVAEKPDSGQLGSKVTENEPNEPDVSMDDTTGSSVATTHANVQETANDYVVLSEVTEVSANGEIDGGSRNAIDCESRIALDCESGTAIDPTSRSIAIDRGLDPLTGGPQCADNSASVSSKSATIPDDCEGNATEETRRIPVLEESWGFCKEIPSTAQETSTNLIDSPPIDDLCPPLPARVRKVRHSAPGDGQGWSYFMLGGAARAVGIEREECASILGQKKVASKMSRDSRNLSSSSKNGSNSKNSAKKKDNYRRQSARRSSWSSLQNANLRRPLDNMIRRMVKKLKFHNDLRDNAIRSTATGSRDVLATATGSRDVLGTGTGSRDVLATATGSRDVLATATGSRDVLATATGSRDVLGAATGSRDVLVHGGSASSDSEASFAVIGSPVGRGRISEGQDLTQRTLDRVSSSDLKDGSAGNVDEQSGDLATNSANVEPVENCDGCSISDSNSGKTVSGLGSDVPGQLATGNNSVNKDNVQVCQTQRSKYHQTGKVDSSKVTSERIGLMRKRSSSKATPEVEAFALEIGAKLVLIRSRLPKKLKPVVQDVKLLRWVVVVLLAFFS